MVYKVSNFIGDAKAVLATEKCLEAKKQEIADRMKLLSQRDDLMQMGVDLGPADAAAGQKLLWLEWPLFLMIVAFDQHSRSPVHEHGAFWVIGCGHRGHDRWDIYERTDDGSVPGRATVKQINEVFVGPGEVVWMPEPPRSIHSHNNIAHERTLELVFSAVEPNPPDEPLVFNKDEGTCYPSGYNVRQSFPVGVRYPPLIAAP